MKEENPAREKTGTVLRGRWKGWNLFVSAVVLLLLFSIPFPGIFCNLQIIHVQGGQVLLMFPFFLRQSFYLRYIHSFYQVPVTERFEVRNCTVHLREISARSWGVVEYYGIHGTLIQEQGEIKVINLDFKLPKLSLMVGYTSEHQLTLRNRVHALYKMVEPGGILSIEVHSISLGRYLWKRLMC